MFRYKVQISLFSHLDRFHLREKEGCDVQNIVTTVIIRVGSDDALWGHWARGVFTPQTRFEKKKIIMKISLDFPSMFFLISGLILMSYITDALQNNKF